MDASRPGFTRRLALAALLVAVACALGLAPRVAQAREYSIDAVDI